MTKTPKNESALIKYCLIIAHKHNWKYIRISSPMLVGYPDYLFFKHNTCFAGEFKHPNIKTPPDNHQTALAKRDNGYKTFFINSIEGFQQVIDFYQDHVVVKNRKTCDIGLFQFWLFK